MASTKLRRLSPWTVALAAAVPTPGNAQVTLPPPECPIWDVSLSNTTVTTTTFCGLEVGDYDLDGAADVVGVGTSSFSYCDGNGNTGFNAVTSYPIASGYELSGAVDRCGATDACALATDTTSGETYLVRIDDVSGSPTLTYAVVTQARHATDLAANGDEVVVCASGELFDPTSAGLYHVAADDTVTKISTGTDKAFKAHWVHLDADGVLDVAALMQDSSGSLRLDAYQGSLSGPPTFIATIHSSPSVGAANDVAWNRGNFYVVSSDLFSQVTFLSAGRRTGGTGFSSSSYQVTSRSEPVFTVAVRAQDTENLGVAPYVDRVDLTLREPNGGLRHLRNFDHGTGSVEATETITPPSSVVCTLVLADFDGDGIEDALDADAATPALSVTPGSRRSHSVPYGGTTCGGGSGPVTLTVDPLVGGYVGQIRLGNTQPFTFNVVVVAAQQASSPLTLGPGCSWPIDFFSTLCTVPVRSVGTSASLRVFTPASAGGAQLHVIGASFDDAGAYLGSLAITNAVKIVVGDCAPTT